MKLTAQELRIGNLVNAFFYGDEPIKIESICSLNNEIFNSITGEIPLISIKPIPLTDEWLLKFGFGKSDEHEYGSNEHDLFGFYYDYHFNKFYLDTPEDNIYIPFIKYVHQLQNIYFSLTNTELKLK